MMKCRICQREIPNEGIIISDEKYFCIECANKFNTCAMCTKGRECEFETNLNPLPKVVVQTKQQNGMTLQAQIKNPEREKLFCERCICFDKELGCLKEFGTCKNYEELKF